MKKDYDKVKKQLQLLIKEAKKLVPMIEKSKHAKEIIEKLENDISIKGLIVEIALEKAKVDMLKYKLNRKINNGNGL